MANLARRLLCGAAVLAAVPGCLTPGDAPTPPDDFRAYRLAPPRETVPRAQIAAADPPAQKPASPPKLDVPPGVPGADATNLALPPDTPDTRGKRLEVIEALFPPLPNLGPDPVVDPSPGTPAVGLEELIAHARANSPVVAQAVTEVENARGQWVQAGLYPNPTAGYQGDQIANLNTAGQQGGFVEQPIVVSKRLKLARAVAYYDFLNAKIRLRRAEIDLARQVRSDYFAVMVAAEGVRVYRLVSEFTGDVYRQQVAMVRGGQSAPFEAAALRAVVGQARNNLTQARNRYTSAWKQLAATLNNPDLPPGPVAGRPDVLVPRYQYDALQARLLGVHTDLAVAANQLAQAERTVTLERVRPVPDLQDHFYFQNDTQANSFQMGVQLGVTVPVWNRNQGAILSAQAQVARYAREGERVRNDLLRQLADAFERYATAREQFGAYREEILPDLVRAFRGVYQRYQVEPDKVNYNDIVTAQQNLANQLGNYLQVLNAQWQAVADLSGLVQADDIYDLSKGVGLAAGDSWPDAAPGRPADARK